MTDQTEKTQSTPAHLTERSFLRPAIQAWKFYLKDQGRSPHTIKAFIADLNLLDSFLPPEETLGEITLKDLEDFTDWLENERGVPCSPKSLSRRITSLKSFFRWLQNSAVLLVDPADKLVQRSVSSPLPDVLSPEEIESGVEITNFNTLGFHVPGMFDKVINIEKCWLQPEPSNEIRNFIYNYALENKYSFFDIK